MKDADIALVAWQRSEALCVFITALGAYYFLGYDWKTFLFFFLLPDITMLAYLANTRIGSVAYNLTHVFVGPSCLAILAFFQGFDFLFPFILIWVAHIGFDRALGFGLKSKKGFKYTHLGFVGNKEHFK